MPDMRKKIEEYLVELDETINRTRKQVDNYTGSDLGAMKHIGYLTALIEVKNDLRSRLKEIVD